MKKWTSLALTSLILGACSQGNNSTAAPQSASPSQAAAEKVYVVATDASYAPMEYEENGKVVGFAPELLTAAAETQGIKLQFVNAPFDSLFAGLSKGDSDIALGSITITDERKQQVDFSEPYFEATQMVVTRQDNGKIKSFADLKSQAVSVQNATTGDLALQKLQGKDSTNIKRFETLPLAFKELENGGVEAAVGDSVVAAYYVQQNPQAKLNAFVDPEFAKESYGLAFRKGRNDGLREAIGKGFAEIKANGKAAQIEQKWFGASNAVSASQASSAQ